MTSDFRCCSLLFSTFPISNLSKPRRARFHRDHRSRTPQEERPLTSRLGFSPCGPFFLSRHHAPQSGNQLRGRVLQLLMMMQGQLRENLLALRRQGEQHLPPVVLGALPPHKASGLKPVDQFHRTVMLHVQTVGYLPDPRPQPLRHPFDRQHQLILRPFQPRGVYSLVAEREEVANLVTKLR